MATRVFPPMPEVGLPEAWYAKMVHRADKAGDTYAHEAYKVGQYITLAMNPALTWEQKLKYLQHALKRHFNPPPFPDDDVWMFYRSLADLVRQYAGQEALRIACKEDDFYARRLQMGQIRDKIADDAGLFFRKLISMEHCPEYFNEEDFRQLKMIRDQWV